MANYSEALSARAEMRKAAKEPKKLSHIRVEAAENGGHVVEHHFEGGMGAYHEPEQHVFGKDEGEDMLAHIAAHMGVKVGKAEGGDEAEKE